MTDGTTSRSVSAASVHGGASSNSATLLAAKALTIVKWNTSTGGMVLAEADLQSWDHTNFTLNWTTNFANEAYVVHYIAIGGTSVDGEGRCLDPGDRRQSRSANHGCRLSAGRRAARERQLPANGGTTNHPPGDSRPGPRGHGRRRPPMGERVLLHR